MSRTAALACQRSEVRQILHGSRIPPAQTPRISTASPRIQRADRLEPFLPLPAGLEGPPSPVGGAGVCIPTTSSGGARTSNTSFEVYYGKDNSNRGEISLRQREASDRALHTVSIPGTPRQGDVTIPSGIAISNENHHYELEMVFYNSRGTRYGGLAGARPVVPFQVCELVVAPTGDHLLFAKAIYAEGVDAGEFPYVRDAIYNRIHWTSEDCCPGDRVDFGHDIRSVLTAPGQFASVLSGTGKFQELEDELTDRSGPCQYTTPPRSGAPARCRLINAAIAAEAAGDGGTHGYVFFRSDTRQPSTRAVNRWQYPGGNHYWEIDSCPESRQATLLRQLRALGMLEPSGLGNSPCATIPGSGGSP